VEIQILTFFDPGMAKPLQTTSNLLRLRQKGGAARLGGEPHPKRFARLFGMDRAELRRMRRRGDG
jgi:hypothetical protein